jgi:hypothetical protein
MLKQAINTALKPLGYEVNNLSRVKQTLHGWTQYKFVKPDGSFDYEQYRALQEWQSRRLDDKVWVTEENIIFLANYLRQHLQSIRFGICHGSKRGNEQEWFAKYLNGKVSVIGTDIAEWAKDFPNTVQWDFHETIPEWLEAADFIYSNALDHSYDPQKAIEAWMACIRPGGCCVVEWHVFGEPVNITDPFSADMPQLLYAITQWGKGRYCVRELIPTPANPDYVNFVVIHKF